MSEKPSKLASSDRPKRLVRQPRVLPPYRRTFPEVLRDLLISFVMFKYLGVNIESLPDLMQNLPM